jgi:hypothetical protein
LYFIADKSLCNNDVGKCKKMLIIDTKPIKEGRSTAIKINDMVLTQNGRILFVANGNDNTVAVIDLPKLKL